MTQHTITYDDATHQVVPIVAMLKSRAAATAASAKPVAERWAPEKCPITQRPFFMWIEHHETGKMVPTYGGPSDSYTLAERDGEGYICERFDHDAGAWVTDCVENIGVRLVDDQALVIEPENPRFDEIEAFAAAPIAPSTEPVGRVKTVGGYPDESRHTIDWLVPYKGLHDGDLLYTAPHPADAQTQPDEASFLTRLHTEADNLDTRWRKLGTFMTTPEFHALPETDKSLMLRQFNQQHALLETLHQRIHSATEQHMRSEHHD